MRYVYIQQMCLFVCVIVGSCKKDTPLPNGTKNFSLVNLQLDNQPFTPANTSSSLTPQISLSFSDRIDHQSAQSTIVLSGTDGTVPSTYSFTNHDSTVTLQPVSPLKYWKVYSLQIASVLTSFSHQGTYSVNSNYTIVTKLDPADKFPRISDNALLDSVQRRTLKYFWDFGHPASGMA